MIAPIRACAVFVLGLAAAAPALRAQTGTATVVKPVNVASAEAGGKVLAFSSSYDVKRYPPDAIIDGKEVAGWIGAMDALPQSFTIELAKEVILTRFSFDNPAYEGPAKEVKVSVSVDDADVGFREAGTYTLARGEVSQGFRLAVPVRARWIKLVILSSHPGGRSVGLGEFRALGFPAGFQTVEDETGFRAILSSEVLFDTDQSSLRSDAEKALAETLSLLQEFPSAKIRIDGHTDSTGTASANNALSLARADAVRDWLEERRGNARWTIETSGLGSAKPVMSNRTPAGRQRNRRVELVILRPANP
jgi:outer membrane protein OmpA-like peptidoglycan-associated protein